MESEGAERVSVFIHTKKKEKGARCVFLSLILVTHTMRLPALLAAALAAAAAVSCEGDGREESDAPAMRSCPPRNRLLRARPPPQPPAYPGPPLV